MKRSNIDEVFTPRRPKVNLKMYVDREDLEKELIRKLRGTQNIIVFGESGCGKSWLYKKVLSQNKIHFEVLNLAYSEILGGILNHMQSEAHSNSIQKIKYTEKKRSIS